MPHPPNALLFRRLTGLSMVPFWLLLIWLIFLTPLALPNMGGSGLKLPQNIITWAVMAAVIGCIWLTLPASKIAHLTATARWLLLAVVILGIPVLYTQHHWHAGLGCSVDGFFMSRCCNTAFLTLVASDCFMAYWQRPLFRHCLLCCSLPCQARYLPG